MWNATDPVEIRANSSQAWVSGVVTTVLDDCYHVTLDTPMTANAWLGITRKYAGTEMITTVNVLKHCPVLVPEKHIRTPVA